MTLDYATMMETCRIRYDLADTADPNMASAALYFETEWLHEDALPCIMNDLATRENLRAAVATRYPDFDALALKERYDLTLHEPISMAVLADFVLCHESLCPDPSLRQDIFRVIHLEIGAMVADAPAYDPWPESIALGSSAFHRAGFASGLAWLRDRIV